MTLQHLCNTNEKSEGIPVIRYEEGDDLIHTRDHPFCTEEGCPCGGIPVVEDIQNAESILLMPVVQVSQFSKTRNTCLHLVYLPDGTLGLCNVKTTQTCMCCGCCMCREHQSTYLVSLVGIWREPDRGLLCKTCEVFPIETIYALRAFRILINEHSALIVPPLRGRRREERS
jgi:hypothetical protein